MRRPRYLAPLLAVSLLLALVLGIYWGGHPSSLPPFARNALVGDSDGRVFDEAIGKIERDYYRKVDPSQLLTTSLSAAVQSLNDRFSTYIPPSGYSDFEQSTQGQFEGVGMTVQSAKGGGLEVVTVYDGSPAKAGGVKPGDRIVAVDGRSVVGRTTTQATALIKGKAGTSVTLTLERGGARHDVTLKRAEVDVPVVRTKLERFDGKKIGWVALSSFTAGAGGEVDADTRRLIAQGAQGIVLDLRDNGGGLLDEAVQVASVFIPQGRIVSTKGRSRPEHVYDATGGAISPKLPMAVLVNGNTASSSEIVTGALQDHKRATVVGTHTYGKGVFQEIEDLSNGGALDITVGEYFTPNGRNLGGGGVRKGAGITPDVQAQDDPKTPKDEALDVALRVVAQKL